MVVLSQLYPVVFLFGMFVQNPVLIKRPESRFGWRWFVGNLVSVVLLNWLVPWATSA